VRGVSLLRRSAAASVLAIALASCGGGGSTSLTTSGPAPTASQSSSFARYTNQTEGFTIDYPVDWERTESIQGAVVVFRSGSEGSTDAVRESVEVATEVLPSATFTLDDFTQAGLGQIMQAVPEFHLISSDAITLAGHPGHQLVYTGKQQTTQLEWMQAFTVVNGKSYSLTFVASPQSFASFQGTAQQMFDSFTLT
jgi:hypothetical protein